MNARGLVVGDNGAIYPSSVTPTFDRVEAGYGFGHGPDLRDYTLPPTTEQLETFQEGLIQAIAYTLTEERSAFNENDYRIDTAPSICLVGLAGAGKSTLAKEMVERGYAGYLVPDGAADFITWPPSYDLTVNLGTGTTEGDIWLKLRQYLEIKMQRHARMNRIYKVMTVNGLIPIIMGGLHRGLVSVCARAGIEEIPPQLIELINSYPLQPTFMFNLIMNEEERQRRILEARDDAERRKLTHSVAPASALLNASLANCTAKFCTFNVTDPKGVETAYRYLDKMGCKQQQFKPPNIEGVYQDLMGFHHHPFLPFSYISGKLLRDSLESNPEFRKRLVHDIRSAMKALSRQVPDASILSTPEGRAYYAMNGDRLAFETHRLNYLLELVTL